MINQQKQTYLITPMLEDFQVSDTMPVTFKKLLEYVDAYNKGTLGHCDAWFELRTLDGTELEISDFYQYLEDGAEK